MRRSPSIEINGEKWVKESYALHLQNGVDVGQEMVDEYRVQVAELEAKIKELEKDLSTNKRVLKMYVDLINGQGEKIIALEEQLKAADEVIAYTEKINFYATHGDVKREYDEALAKYQSLKK